MDWTTKAPKGHGLYWAVRKKYNLNESCVCLVLVTRTTLTVAFEEVWPRELGPLSPKYTHWMSADMPALPLGVDIKPIPAADKKPRPAASDKVKKGDLQQASAPVVPPEFSKPAADDGTTPLMENVAERSSNVTDIGHNPQTWVMVVRYKGGRAYRYQNVPPTLYHRIFCGSSIGKALQEVKKNPAKYPCSPVL